MIIITIYIHIYIFLSSDSYSRFNNTPIQSESMNSPSLQTSSLVNDSLLNSVGLFTASDPNLTGGLAQCTTTYCCSYYPRLNSRVVNRNNDCCLPSFHHISSSTNLNSNPIVCSSFNNCSNNLFNKMSKSMAVSESNIDGCGKFRTTNNFLMDEWLNTSKGNYLLLRFHHTFSPNS